MTRNLEEVHAWVREGSVWFIKAVHALDEPDWDAATHLPGWNRRHLVAHVAANADALVNLVTWAATGVPTPMYSSPEQRATDIEAGSRLTPEDLVAWLQSATQRYSDAVGALTPGQWTHEVQTAQGRSVPASEIPWLRAREVWVHSVDLACGTEFAQLPNGFLRALAEDIVKKRSAVPSVAVSLQADDLRWSLPGEGPGVTVSRSLPEIVAYLAGRDSAAESADGVAPPALPAWL